MDQSKDKGRSEATFKFVVPQLSKYQLEDELLSHPCYINNIGWNIIVETQTSDSQNETPSTRTLGVFLECDGGSESTFWAYYAEAELKLLSVRPDVKPFSRKINNLFYSMQPNWGYEEFISWNYVLNADNGFIRDDTITLEVHVSVKQDLLQTIRYQLPKVVEQVVREFKLCSSEKLSVEEYVQMLLNTFENKKIKTVIDAKKNAKKLTKNLEVQQRKVEELTAANHELETVKENLEKQVAALNEQLTDAKKKADEAAVFEENEKKLMKDLEAQQRQIGELTVANDELEMSEKKITAELEDANIELETQGSKVDGLENRLKNLKILTEEKATKTDIVEDDAKEKESKVSSLRQGSQGTVDKNVVVEVEKVKSQLTEFKAQNGKLENELQLTKDAKLSLEVNMQALSGQFRDSQVQKKQAVEKHREINNHLKDIEAELDEERKQRIAAVTSKRKLEGYLKGMESYVEHLCKVKEDTFKQLEKLQQQCQEATWVAEEAQAARNELTAKNKDAERKLKNLEIELSQVSKDSTNSEHARKAAEAERDGFQEEINNSAYECSLLISEKRQLEARIATLEEELEEKQNNNDTLVEKVRKAKVSVESFQWKATNLEEQLEVEAKERFAQQKANRKLEKNLRELAIQLEGERRHADQYKQQLEKINTSVKALKCQLNGTKDEICREKAQRQKAQREYEGILESHESLIQENSILKEKLRRITGGSIFSSSICSSKRGSIQSSENGFEDNSTTQKENPDEDDVPS